MNFKWLIVFLFFAVIIGGCRNHGGNNMEESKNSQSSEVETYFSQGYAKENDGDYAGAIEAYSQAIDRALQLGTIEYVLYSTRAEAKQELKDYQGAIEDFTHAIELDPKRIVLYWERAEAKEQLKDYTGALEDLTKAIGLSSGATLASSYAARARIKQILGDEAGAKADKEKELEIIGKSSAKWE